MKPLPARETAAAGTCTRAIRTWPAHRFLPNVKSSQSPPDFPPEKPETQKPASFMKPLAFPSLLAGVSLLSFSPSLSAHQAEADFNDMFIGDTRTRTNSGSPNNLNLNSGSGFLPANDSANGGNGEYNNDTGVVQFEAGDLSVPAGVSHFISNQGGDVNGGTGVVFGSHEGSVFTRMQERAFATPFTGGEIWFSFLFQLTGPAAQGQIVFNVPATTVAATASGAIGISMGAFGTPGALAINLNPAQSPASLITPGTATASLVYYDDLNGNGIMDEGESDLNGNGVIDGVDVGLGGASNVGSHLIIGRILHNPDGEDTVDIWLDPPDALDPTANPSTLSVVSDIFGAGGVFSVGFEGTRRNAPLPPGGPYTDGGHWAVDHFRMSDNANALDFVTGNVAADPNLIIAPDSPATNFNFAGIYGSGETLSSAPRTVKLLNSGASESVTITGISFANGNPNGVFSILSAPELPLTLSPGQSTNLTIQAASGVFETLFSDMLLIDTDHDTSDNPQDRSIGAAATFFGAGSRTNLNPGLNTNYTSWLSDKFSTQSPAVHVTPGFGGTSGMVRLRGEGDIAGGGPNNLSQRVLNGAADWEFAFFVSPLDASEFPAYTGFDMIGADRTFQVVIQSDNNPPIEASGTLGTFTDTVNADAAMINLAYLPAAGGLSVFDGNDWQSLGLPALAGSVDADLDGRLDPAGDDTVNYYLVRIKGTGFGTPAARYSVSVSQPNSTITVAKAENLTLFHAADITANTPGAYTFTTGDVSTRSGEDGFAVSLPFWIDEVSFFSVATRDPDISLNGRLAVTSHNAGPASGDLRVFNTGFENALEISALDFGDPAFSSSVGLPLSIPGGSSASIPVVFDPEGFSPGNNAARTTLTLHTNAPYQPVRTVNTVAAVTTDDNVLANWNLETPGSDPANPADVFAFWENTGNVRAVPGLRAGSGTAAYLPGGTALIQPMPATPEHFVVEFDFAIRETANRQFNVLLDRPSNTINLRYEAGQWSVFSNAWNPVIDHLLATSDDADGNFSLDDEGDTKNVHRLRIACNNWTGTTPTYRIQIVDAGGNVIASSAPDLAWFQNAGFGYQFRIDARNGSIPAFWIDDIQLAAIVSSTVEIVSISGGPGGFTIVWNSGGAPVTVERSTDLIEWTPISAADADGTHTDTTAPAGRAFYRLVTP